MKDPFALFNWYVFPIDEAEKKAREAYKIYKQASSCNKRTSEDAWFKALDECAHKKSALNGVLRWLAINNIANNEFKHYC